MSFSSIIVFLDILQTSQTLNCSTKVFPQLPKQMKGFKSDLKCSIIFTTILSFILSLSSIDIL